MGGGNYFGGGGFVGSSGAAAAFCQVRYDGCPPTPPLDRYMIEIPSNLSIIYPPLALLTIRAAVYCLPIVRIHDRGG